MKNDKLVLMSVEKSEGDEFCGFEPTVEPLFVRDVLNVLSGDSRKFGDVEDGRVVGVCG